MQWAPPRFMDRMAGRRLPAGFGGRACVKLYCSSSSSSAAAASCPPKRVWKSATLHKFQKRMASVGSAAALNSAVAVKLELAASLDRLDLSNQGLTEIPREVFQLEGLTDLSLAGNSIKHLPEEIGRLRSLERFVIAGNLLQELPESMGNLQQLEGFWCHGNLLEGLPQSFGELVHLKRCSLSGNRIEQLPPCVGQLQDLELLEIAGNRLMALPDDMGRMMNLKKLVLHGNRIQSLPRTLARCTALQTLMVQGNCLKQVDCESALSPALKVVNLADNRLESLQGDVTHLAQLEEFVLYGNKLTSLPARLLGLPSMKKAWLEGNPLSKEEMQRKVCSQASWGPSLRKLGLDEKQLGVCPGGVNFGSGGEPSQGFDVVQKSEIRSSGRGYFKLVKRGSNILVIAFGSAPGETNWSGLLGRVAKDGGDDEICFDVLYVVDPTRDWFGGGGEAFERYRETVERTAGKYEKCVMIGESMGGSAALMFSSYATSVLAFCPQVDLAKSSIRPASGPESWEMLREKVLAGVAESAANILVFTGNWDHDIHQVQQLDQSRIKWKVFGVDSHRLAIYLDMNQKLAPLLKAEMGFPSGEVRLSNLF